MFLENNLGIGRVEENFLFCSREIIMAFFISFNTFKPDQGTRGGGVQKTWRAYFLTFIGKFFDMNHKIQPNASCDAPFKCNFNLIFI